MQKIYFAREIQEKYTFYMYILIIIYFSICIFDAFHLGLIKQKKSYVYLIHIKINKFIFNLINRCSIPSF